MSLTDVRRRPYGTEPPRGDADEPHLGVPRWQVELERAHAELRRAAIVLERGAAPAATLPPAARALESSFRALYDAFDSRVDSLHAVRDAVAELDRADGLLAPASVDPAVAGCREHLALARRHLLVADERLAVLPPPARAPASDLRASGNVPALHRVDRSSLVPVLRVLEPPPPEPEVTPPPPPPAPRSFEELDAAFAALRQRMEARKARPRSKASPAPPATPEIPAGFAPDPLPAIDERSFVFARARDCFEEITMVGQQRAPLFGDPWRSALFLERRMIAAIDAIVSLGPTAIAYLERLVLDAPASDASRVFAIGMALGSLEGRDALAAAERVMGSVARTDAEAARQLAAALQLTSHPLVPLVMRTYLTDPDRDLRAMAIDVLGYRQLATPAELLAAAGDVPAVARVALPYLALSGHPGTVEAARAALATSDRSLTEAAWVALVLAGDPRISTLLAAELSNPEAPAAPLLLAVVGESEDAAQILAAANAAPARPLVDAVGWAGAGSAIVPLMAMLEQSKPDIALAAAYALERITAAGLYEDTEVEPDRIDLPEPAEPDVGEPKQMRLARAVSDPRDLPPEPAAEIVQQPTTDPQRWRAWWKDNAARFDARSRCRRGQPYSPAVVLGELDTGPCTPGERRTLYRELCVRTGERLRFDPHDWVVVQEASIEAWRPVAVRASSMPGRWTRPLRRG